MVTHTRTPMHRVHTRVLSRRSRSLTRSQFTDCFPKCCHTAEANPRKVGCSRVDNDDNHCVQKATSTRSVKEESIEGENVRGCINDKKRNKETEKEITKWEQEL